MVVSLVSVIWDGIDLKNRENVDSESSKKIEQVSKQSEEMIEECKKDLRGNLVYEIGIKEASKKMRGKKFT